MYHILRVPEIPFSWYKDSLLFYFFLNVSCQIRAICFGCLVFLKKQQLPNRMTNEVTGIAALQKGFAKHWLSGFCEQNKVKHVHFYSCMLQFVPQKMAQTW